MLRNLFSAFSDLARVWLPARTDQAYSFAFVLHPRSVQDVYLKFAPLKYVPESFVLACTRNFWPITMSRITGLKSDTSGHEIPGWVISIPLTAKQIVEDKDMALKHLRWALKLATRRGARLVGLGALTSSISHRGLDLVGQSSAAITTGHAYTVHNVTQTLLSIAQELARVPKDSTVAIVGASGSIGSGCALVLAQHRFKKLVLIDVTNKNSDLQDLLLEIQQYDQGMELKVSHHIRDVNEADFVITATNAPEALVTAHDLKSGAVIIDDAQPTDVDASVYLRDDVLVLEAGAVHTPGISAHLRLGLMDRFDNYSCLAEVLALASMEYHEDFVVGKVTLKQIDEISKRGALLGFSISPFQNEVQGLISSDKIQALKMMNRKET